MMWKEMVVLPAKNVAGWSAIGCEECEDHSKYPAHSYFGSRYDSKLTSLSFIMLREAASASSRVKNWIKI